MARYSRDRPSIAVLPLQNSATDSDCRAFGEYIAEGVATVLCRVRSLSVTISKPSRVKLADPRQRARDVGTRYLLSGRIAQTGNRVRVIIRLLEAETDAHVWGDRYDGLIKDLFELADRVTEGVMQAIPPHIRGSEIERARRKRPESLAAYGLTMRAFPFVSASSGCCETSPGVSVSRDRNRARLCACNSPSSVVPRATYPIQRHSITEPRAKKRAAA